MTDLKNFLICKSDLLKTDKTKSLKFVYDFDEISKENYSVDPNKISKLNTPLEFIFFMIRINKNIYLMQLKCILNTHLKDSFLINQT